MRPAVVLTRAQLAELGEYSCSLPTGTMIGKRWKRNETAYARIRYRPEDREGAPLSRFRGPEWWLGEYVESALPEHVDIHWTPIVIAEELDPANAVEWTRALP